MKRILIFGLCVLAPIGFVAALRAWGHSPPPHNRLLSSAELEQYFAAIEKEKLKP